jgi:hypothetical protein
MPVLLATHFDLKREWQNEMFTRGETWDMLNNSLMTAITPLLIGWIARVGFQYMPAALGGRTIPGAIRLMSERMGPGLDIYWRSIFWAIGADILFSGWQIGNNFLDVSSLNRLSMTNPDGRSLISYNSYLLARERLIDERSQWYFRLGQNLFWVSFPYVSEFALKRVILPRQNRQVMKTEDAFKKARERAGSSRNDINNELLAKATSKIYRHLDTTRRWLTHDYKALGLEYGEMQASVIEKAYLQRLKQATTLAEKARAEEAYKRIVRESVEALSKYENAPAQLSIATRIGPRTTEELNQLRNLYNNLFSPRGDKL